MKKNNLKITINAPVTLAFVFLAFIVLLLGIVTGGASTQRLFMTYRASLLSPLTWLRFVTHVLGHSGWDHYVGNTAYIRLLGPMLEEKYGSDKILSGHHGTGQFHPLPRQRSMRGERRGLCLHPSDLFRKLPPG